MISSRRSTQANEEQEQSRPRVRWLASVETAAMLVAAIAVAGVPELAEALAVGDVSRTVTALLLALAILAVASGLTVRVLGWLRDDMSAPTTRSEGLDRLAVRIGRQRAALREVAQPRRRNNG